MTLIGRPGCHLCDDAREVVTGVCAQTGEAWVELSIEDDPALFDEHWERIPVVLVDGLPHDFWVIDAQRLESALTAPAGPSPR